MITKKLTFQRVLTIRKWTDVLVNLCQEDDDVVLGIEQQLANDTFLDFSTSWIVSDNGSSLVSGNKNMKEPAKRAKPPHTVLGIYQQDRP